MIKEGDVFEPNKEHVKLYSRLYHEVYLKMSGTLHHLNVKIRNITNYPEII